MRRILTILFFSYTILNAQDPVVISGIDTTLNIWTGYGMDRSSPIELLIENSKFIQPLDERYVLKIGDDSYNETNSLNVNGAIITGNQIIATYGEGVGQSVHGSMSGYNLDYKIKFNYFDETYYGVVAEGGYDSGEPMKNSSYYIYGNIFRNVVSPFNESGYDSVLFCNNTCYFGELMPPYWYCGPGFSNGTDIPARSKNIVIKNNIFYSSTNNDRFIGVPAGCDTGFVCDYNVYWVAEKSGNQPRFLFKNTVYSWSQWRALGYDTHSIVIDPNFIDTIGLVPTERLDYGDDLSSHYSYGLSSIAEWAVGSHPDTTQQDDVWQVGAYVIGGESSSMKNIFEFTFVNQRVASVIDTVNHTVLAIVGGSKTNLLPIISYSGTSIDPASGVSQDFTNPVTYRVTAVDESYVDYVVTVITRNLLTSPEGNRYLMPDGTFLQFDE